MSPATHQGFWIVRSDRPGPPTSSHWNRDDAIESALKEVSAARGGIVHVYTEDGVPQFDLPVADPRHPDPALAPQREPTPVDSARENISTFENFLSFASEHVWPIFPLLGAGPLLNGLITPTLQEQTTLAGIFLSTLAWSLGVAGVTVTLLWRKDNPESTGGYPLAFFLVLILLASSSVATWLQIGNYTAPVATGSPPVMLINFAVAAMLTWGPFGAWLGGISGFLVGAWVYAHFGRGTAHQ